MDKSHKWTFFKAAGVLQPRVKDADDIRDIANLPDELWTILSIPAKGHFFDKATFDMLDADSDGHVRIKEVRNEVAWFCKCAKDPAVVFEGKDAAALDELADTDEGNKLRNEAKMVLASVGKADATAITLADVTQRSASFLASPFNGDGVVTEASADDAAAKKLIGEVVAATGGVDDRSGAKGVDKAKLAEFVEMASAHIDWLSKGKSDQSIFSLGDQTAAAADAVAAVEAKVNDYFLRTHFAGYDDNAAKRLAGSEADFADLASADLASSIGKLKDLPLAAIGAGRPLPLAKGVNPVWSDAMAAFVANAVTPILGRTPSELAEPEWRGILAKVAPYRGWQASIAGAQVAALGEARLREIIDDAKTRDAVVSLIEKDSSMAPEIDNLREIEKYLRLRANLAELFDNYVGLVSFYDPRRQDIFRAGRLFIAGRVCGLTMFVDDVAAHSALAESSKIHLLYCEVTRAKTAEKKNVCVAVTAGFASSLTIGRRGVFIDRTGNDWEAVVTKIVESQISLREAFWSPWRKISDMIGNQVKKLLSSKEETMLSAASTNVGTIGTPAAPKPAEKMNGAALASSVAAIGIAVGLIGSAVGGLVSVVSGLPFWKVLLGIAAVILIVSLPSVALAWFKLRARDIGPMLNANGWAVNHKLPITFKLGRVFTHLARIPLGSKFEMHDPYAERHTLRNILIVLAVLAIAAAVLWHMGLLDGILDWVRALFHGAPADVPPAEVPPVA